MTAKSKRIYTKGVPETKSKKSFFCEKRNEYSGLTTYSSYTYQFTLHTRKKKNKLQHSLYGNRNRFDNNLTSLIQRFTEDLRRFSNNTSLSQFNSYFQYLHTTYYTEFKSYLLIHSSDILLKIILQLLSLKKILVICENFENEEKRTILNLFQTLSVSINHSISNIPQYLRNENITFSRTGQYITQINSQCSQIRKRKIEKERIQNKRRKAEKNEKKQNERQKAERNEKDKNERRNAERNEKKQNERRASKQNQQQRELMTTLREKKKLENEGKTASTIAKLIQEKFQNQKDKILKLVVVF